MKITLRQKQQLHTIGLVVILLSVFYFLFFQLFSEPEWNQENDESEIPGQVPVPAQQKPINSKLEPFKTEDLINHLKNHHLHPPARSNVPYNFSVKYPDLDDHNKYHKTLLELVEKHHKIENGFFVEAGALDGQYLSHTLDLEMKHGWNGLLVEASPSRTEELRSKNRKCWSANVCLTGKPFMKIEYLASKGIHKTTWTRGNGKINFEKSGLKLRHTQDEKGYVSEGDVECFSLFSLLTALDVKMVDLLVLDIEGHEFEVLKGYPYKEIPIKVIAVEHWLLPIPSKELKRFMLGKGYKLIFESKSDYVFVLNK